VVVARMTSTTMNVVAPREDDAQAMAAGSSATSTVSARAGVVGG